MKAQTVLPRFTVLVAASSLLLVALAHGDGIPELGSILYGSVTNTTGGFVLTSGGVQWHVSGGGSTTTASATIANVNGQPFYLARIPFETRFAGNLTFTPSPNTLPLTAVPTNFTRIATVNGVAATLVPPASTNFTFSKADRGRIVAADVRRLTLADPKHRMGSAEFSPQPCSMAAISKSLDAA